MHVESHQIFVTKFDTDNIPQPSRVQLPVSMGVLSVVLMPGDMLYVNIITDNSQAVLRANGPAGTSLYFYVLPNDVQLPISTGKFLGSFLIETTLYHVFLSV